MKQSTQERKEGEKKDKIEGLKSWQNAISLCTTTTLRGFPRTRTLRDYLYQGGEILVFLYVLVFP
jgi:nicotinic acid mononucleotide adenylyltransferase